MAAVYRCIKVDFWFNYHYRTTLSLVLVYHSRYMLTIGKGFLCKGTPGGRGLATKAKAFVEVIGNSE